MCLHIVLVRKVRERRIPVQEGQQQLLHSGRPCWEQPGMSSQPLWATERFYSMGPCSHVGPSAPESVAYFLSETVTDVGLLLPPVGSVLQGTQTRGEWWAVSPSEEGWRGRPAEPSGWHLHPYTPMVLPSETLVLTTELGPTFGCDVV